jgi:lipopolysaccharide transport system permease protein
VPAKWRPLYGLNPMAGVIEGFRWSLTGTGSPPSRMLLVSAAVVVAILVAGMMYFQKMESKIADVV